MNQFVAFFHDAHTLKNLMAMLHREQTKIPLIVSAEGILISFRNKTDCALFHTMLRGDDLLKFDYDGEDENGEKIPQVSFVIDTRDMNRAVKSLGKKDSLRLSLEKGENKLEISPQLKGNGSSTYVELEYQAMESEYELQDYSVTANLRIPAKEFTSSCSNMGTLGCTSVQIKGYKEGVIFNGLKAEEFILRTDKFGETPNPTNKFTNITISEDIESDNEIEIADQEQFPRDDIISDLFIPIYTIRTLSKLANLSPQNGLIKLFFNKGGPMKLECHIGSYGILELALRSKRS